MTFIEPFDHVEQATARPGERRRLLRKITKIETLHLEPGDRILAQLPRDIATVETLQSVKQCLEEAFPGHEVLVLVGIELKVARGE